MTEVIKGTKEEFMLNVVGGVSLEGWNQEKEQDFNSRNKRRYLAPRRLIHAWALYPVVH